MNTEINSNLSDIADKIELLDLTLKIDELDIDLDAITTQLEINNKLRFLELVSTSVMSEQDQTAAYNEIKSVLFASEESSDEEEQS